MKKLILLLVATIFTYVGVNAQDVLTTEQMNSVYKKEKHHEKKVQHYAPLRQADVMWSRKVWREIDLRQKINHPFYYPENNGIVGAAVTGDRKSLIDVIYSAIKEGSITAYGNAVYDDEMRVPMTQQEINSVGGAKEEIIEVTDWDAVALGADPEDAKTTRTNIVPFNRNTVKKWRLKEEWFFDKQRSVMDVRIIGIHPIVEKQNAETGDMELLQTFWVYYPEARFVFANNEVFNRTNDSERRTFEDIFWKRQFASRIVKVSNVYDRDIANYRSGIDALLESEKLKEEIFNVEHDLWSY